MHRTMCVTESTTLVDGPESFSTPDPFPNLGQLLTAVASRAPRLGMTLLLDGAAHTLAGLPKNQPKSIYAASDALKTAMTYGWMSNDLRPWMAFRNKTAPTVAVGILPWLSSRNCGLYEDDRADMIARMSRYSELLGVPYWGKHEGLPAMSLLRDAHRGAIPMWQPRNWADIEPATRPTEVAWGHWASHDQHGQPFEHEYDTRRAYLTIAEHLPLALGELEYTSGEIYGPVRRRNVPGYYLTTVSPWPYASVLPHPAGPGAVPGESMWITAPTLDLLNEIADAYGMTDPPEVQACWIAQQQGKHGKYQTGRCLRLWAEQIGAALKVAEGAGDLKLITAFKNTYKFGIGMLDTPNSRVRRPDWAHAVIAQARANLFRKIFLQFSRDRRCPVVIDYDAVWYACPNADPNSAQSWPSTFEKSGDAGKMRAKGSRAVSTSERPL